VGQTVKRIKDLATERRFGDYLKRLPAHVKKENATGVLRQEWQDAIPYRLREKHEALASEWELGSTEHQVRLAKMMYQWVIKDNVPQREVGERLRFISLGTRCEEETAAGRITTGSYLEAVQQDGTHAEAQLNAEQRRLRELCMEQFHPTSKLRPRTADETAAIVMILNHAIDVPAVPSFLTQSMAPGELAVFEDLFKALEYSLYAHIAPGQRFFSNMAPDVIMAQIHCGTEAAPAHKHRIEEFKRELSRIALDMRSRILKVTFKGRAVAAKWVGWQLPLATKMLTLVDYDMIRERAKRTYEFVMMDYYSFVVEVRKGVMTSREMYKMLKDVLGLKVQAMQHTRTPTMGIQEMQWQVRVQASECPACIEDKGYIVQGEVEVVIHHVGTHVNWPCRTGLSPAHPTRVCTVEKETVDAERSKNTCTLPGAVIPEKGNAGSGSGAAGHARAMAQLERFLRNEGRGQQRPPTASSTAYEGANQPEPPGMPEEKTQHLQTTNAPAGSTTGRVGAGSGRTERTVETNGADHSNHDGAGKRNAEMAAEQQRSKQESKTERDGDDEAKETEMVAGSRADIEVTMTDMASPAAEEAPTLKTDDEVAAQSDEKAEVGGQGYGSAKDSREKRAADPDADGEVEVGGDEG
jgi:hypothetical protein